MSNLFLRICYEDMEVVPNIIPIKNFIGSAKNITFKEIEKLYTLVLKEKGDWLDFDYDFFNETFYIDIKLIFKDKVLSIEEKEIIKNITSICDEFIKNNKSHLLDSSINNADRLFEIFLSDGFLLEISTNDGVGDLDIKSIESIFHENEIKFETISISKRSSDGGASGALETLLYFIISSAASGITWDMIKSVLQSNIKFPIQNVTMRAMEKYNFNKLRKVIADRIREEEKNLILIEYYKKSSKINLVFRVVNKKIYIKCDKDFNIIDFKLVDDV